MIARTTGSRFESLNGVAGEVAAHPGRDRRPVEQDGVVRLPAQGLQVHHQLQVEVLRLTQQAEQTSA